MKNEFMISIGEDGSGLGWNKFCEGKFDDVVSEMDLSDEDEKIVGVEIFGGNIFYIQNDMEVVEWEKLKKECEDYEVVSKEEVKEMIKDVIKGVKEIWEEDVEYKESYFDVLN